MDSEDSKVCPKCNQQITVPTVYWTGGERPAARRNCQCRARDGSFNPDPGSANYELANKIDQLEKWVDILLHLIPQGYASKAFSVAEYSGKDLNKVFTNDQSKRPPSQVLNAVAACSEEVRNASHYDRKTLECDLCVYCGSTWNHSPMALEAPGRKASDARVRGLMTCYRCDHIKSVSPEVFGWVTDMLSMVYKVAAYTPPPPPPTGHRNILVNGEGPPVMSL
jgi:hypothetical protein